MKTKLLRSLSLGIVCLFLVFVFQETTGASGSRIECPPGFYYTECIPTAEAGPCYPGCAPKPGLELEVSGQEVKSISMKCLLAPIEWKCHATCKKGHHFESIYKGQVTKVLSACPVCGTADFDI